jgi:hypothetical protein
MKKVVLLLGVCAMSLNLSFGAAFRNTKPCFLYCK